MLINARAAEEVRMALVEDGVLTDLDIETQNREKSRGNIYKGIVANVEGSLNAAFIEFGHAKQGFLAFDDLRPELYDPAWTGEGRPRISDVLKRGQHIVVQVVKEEIGNKGAAVTSFLSLPGRYVVLMHAGGGRGGVSRKIDDERERARAKEALDKLKVPDDLGVIIRTAGIGKSRAELQRDLNALTRQWHKMFEAADIARPPSLLYREPDLVVRTIRDYLTSDIDEVLIDDQDEYEDALEYFSGQGAGSDSEPPGEEGVPEEKKGEDLIKYYQGTAPLFERYAVEDQIEALYKRQVTLPSGGYVIIDQTEALVSIDVNSGKSNKEDDHESTVYKTNLEAVEEIARQLRLRDMGGIIVIDLIDMASRKHDRDVENRLREAVKADKARVKIGRISENGLLEMTRQRVRQAHRLVSHVPCPTCTGTGVIRAIPGQAVAALRELQARAVAANGLVSRLAVRLPIEVANHLSNHKRTELDELAKQYSLRVEVLADHTLSHGESKVEEERRGKAALVAPVVPVVREDDWRTRRRARSEERGAAGGGEGAGVSIEEKQEQAFEADRGRRGRGRWDRGGERGDRGDRGRGDRGERADRGDRGGDRGRGDRPRLEAVDLRDDARPVQEVRPPRPPHYPEDALMEALFGEPPPLVAEPPVQPGDILSAPLSELPAGALPPAGEPGALPAGDQPAVAGQPGVPGQPGQPGQPGEGGRKRRRRRRRRRGGGVDPLTGLPYPQPQNGQPAPGASAADEGDDDEGDDDEGAVPAPVPLPPDLLTAATAVILDNTTPVHFGGGPQLEAPTRAPARGGEVRDASDVLAEMEARSGAPAASEDDTGDEPEDVPTDGVSIDLDEDDTGEEELPPLPPAAEGAETAAGEQPTVLAKRASRRPGAAAARSRSRTPRARARKKAAPRKKPEE